MGLAALQHVGSSHTRDWTHVSCTGRWILYHWATREAPVHILRTCEDTDTVLVDMCQQRERLMPGILPDNDDTKQTEGFPETSWRPRELCGKSFCHSGVAFWSTCHQDPETHQMFCASAVLTGKGAQASELEQRQEGRKGRACEETCKNSNWLICRERGDHILCGLHSAVVTFPWISFSVWF